MTQNTRIREFRLSLMLWGAIAFGIMCMFVTGVSRGRTLPEP